MATSMRITHSDFNLGITLDSGQVFGFEKLSETEYRGRAAGRVVRFKAQKNGMLSVDCEAPLSKEAIIHYFDLEKDLAPVYQALKQEERLHPALQMCRGLRIIRQDSWEALACFILSSNNNVKRIQGIWKNMVDYFGGFPSARQIARSHDRILRQLGLGYRAPFLMSTACFVAANPVCLDMIREAPYEEAVRRVIRFPGIGPKVADCALLYGFYKQEAFPVDVWILRIMRKLYFRGRSVSEKRIQVYGQKKWGRDAGYVQQYLFHAARTGILVE